MPLNVLRPTERELEDMARAETDPALYPSFKPICRGPIFAILALAFAGIMALVALPTRALRFWLRGSA